MKVLQVIDKLEIGGAEKVFIDLVNLLYENNSDINILTLLSTKRTELINNGVKKYCLNRKNKWSLIKMYFCYRTIKKYDIIHCHQRYVFTYIKICSLLFLINKDRCRILLHDHNSEIPKNSLIGLKFLFKPEYYLGVSQELCNWALKYLDVEKSKVFLLSNVVRKPVFCQKTKEYDMVLVSNIKPIKNQLFAIALSKNLNRRLLIIGNIQDDNYYKLVQDAIKGFENLIQIKTGVENVIPYLQKSKLGLHVSISESGPLAIIEYMSVGLPFISYNTGDITNQVNKHFPELIQYDFNINNWVKQLITIGNENHLELEERILKSFSLLFDEMKYVERCQSIYKEIL
jgi:glycosyltransferase involved in cell wall biosynthesis